VKFWRLFRDDEDQTAYFIIPGPVSKRVDVGDNGESKEL